MEPDPKRASRRLALWIILLTACLSGNVRLSAQETGSSVNIAMDARADFDYDITDKESGFHGRYLNFMVNGDINSHFSYSLRQRLNKFGSWGNDVFGATDWIWLSYAPNERWSVSAGKQVVLVGGFEYDAAPIDIIFASRYWNNIACYQFGASGTLKSADGKHGLTLQVCNSPYAPIGRSCFAYNLYWAGRMGRYSTLWSVNMIEYRPEHYVNYLALGNRLDLGRVNLELDWMNRAVGHRAFFRDFTVIGKAEVSVTPWLTLMAKGGYDSICVDDDDEVMPGSDRLLKRPFYGGGLEAFPLKGKHDVRLHAMVYRQSDNSGADYTTLSVGLKWRVNLYNHH